MSLHTTPVAANRRLGRGILSVAAGFAVIVVLSYGADYGLDALGVFDAEASLSGYGSGLVAVILAYRIAFSVVGAYVTARLAPRRPMTHALALGGFGLVISTAGAVVGSLLDLGPAWYLWGLVVLALPAAWLGGRLFESTAPRARRSTEPPVS